MPAELYVGDDVDYSAPYLTVENGELVTKYPAKQHSADPVAWIGPVLAVAVLFALLLLRRRRPK